MCRFSVNPGKIGLNALEETDDRIDQDTKRGLDSLKEMLPDADFLPAIETPGHGAPAPKTFGQIAPGSTGTQNSQDAIDDASMGQSRSTHF